MISESLEEVKVSEDDAELVLGVERGVAARLNLCFEVSAMGAYDALGRCVQWMRSVWTAGSPSEAAVYHRSCNGGSAPKWDHVIF